MRINAIRNKSGDVIGTYEPEAVRTPDGTVEVGPDPEEDFELEELEMMRHETFDIDALHKGLTRKKGAK